MDTLNRLIAAAVKACDPPTVVELKDRLGVSRQTIYDWKTGASAITDDHLARLIELAAGTPEDAVQIRKERARSDHERALWRSLARRLGAAASVAAVALSLTTFATVEAGTLTASQVMHYAKWWLDRLRASLPFPAARWPHGPATVLA